MTGVLLLRAISTLFHNIIGIIFGAGNQFHDYIAFQKDFFEDMDFGVIHNSNMFHGFLLLYIAKL
jgi:hypothetical protein